MTDGERDGWLLAIDTGTSRIVLAAGRPDGSVLRVLEWPAGYRHGELLLTGLEQLLRETGLARADLRGVIVGTGPGAFTGLRVGLATAKTLAHAVGLPIAGIGTGDALLLAAAASSAAAHAVGLAAQLPADAGDGTSSAANLELALLLPAGPHDRVLVRAGARAILLPGGLEPELPPDCQLVAVDLDGRASSDALARGAAAAAGLGSALLELGARRLAASAGDDVERLVPEYVTLPRGVRASVGEIEWSRDPR